MTSYRYPSYRDSGVPWLDHIPAHWEVRQSKRLFSERKGRLQKGDQQLTASQKHGVIPQAVFSELEGHRVVQVILGSEILKHVEPNDFVISMRSFQGGLEHSKYRGCISSAYVMLVPNDEVSPGFFRHLFKSTRYIQALQATSNLVRDGQAMRFANFSQVPLPILPRDEQDQIADFLDRETARIDLLIKKKQRLVALLGEKLQAKISALVKGNSPSNTVRLRHTVRLNPTARHLRLEPDAPVTFCPMEAIQDGVGGIDTSNIRPLSDVASASYNFFAEGDILLAKVTPCFENGKKALAFNLTNGVGFATSEVFVVRPESRQVYPEYLVYLFSSYDFQYAGRSSMTGAGGLRRISERSILDFPLFVIDRRQQMEIVENIDAEVSRSKAISDKTNASMDRLKEYRSALITAAVTGQIDVMTYTKSGIPDRHLDAIQEEMEA